MSQAGLKLRDDIKPFVVYTGFMLVSAAGDRRRLQVLLIEHASSLHSFIFVFGSELAAL